MKPVLLVIMDGFGLAEDGPGNAISLASKPYYDELWAQRPHTTLGASGRDVGLPDGQMGNSEVGHLNMGAGRVVRSSRALTMHARTAASKRTRFSSRRWMQPLT